MTKEQVNKKIGENIRKVRQNMELTQRELSEYLSLSPEYLGSIERGKRTADIHTLLAISDILNVSLNNLINLGDSLLLLDNCKNSLKVKKNFILILMSALAEPDLNFLITMIKYIRRIRTV